MSPMLDVQRRAASKGRIRTGITVRTERGTRPEKLERFLITTESAAIADAVAATYGGKVAPYRPMGKEEQRGWQVLIDAEEIPVVVPPGGGAVSQWWEQWTGAGLGVRCDGETATRWEPGGSKDGTRCPCACPADLMDRKEAASGNRPTACRPSTRVSLMLPDVPGTGTFMVESHGLSAAAEMSGVAEAMEKALQAGIMLPARLRLEQREGVRRPGQTTNRFAVPVLDLIHTPRQLLELAANPPAGMLLPPAPESVALLESGRPDPRDETEPHDDGPAGESGPDGPQALYEAASDCVELGTLTALARQAQARGWMGEVVETEPDVFEDLGPALISLRDRLA